MKEVYPGDSVHSLLSILDVITVGFTKNLLTHTHTETEEGVACGPPLCNQPRTELCSAASVRLRVHFGL